MGSSPGGARKRVGRSGCACTEQVHAQGRHRAARAARRPLGLGVHHAGARTGSSPSGARSASAARVVRAPR
eukprot:1652301-Pleurochrysis_carterae.AAC.1